MELTHNWKAYQQTFFPNRRTLAGSEAEEASAPLFLVVEGQPSEDSVVVAVHGEGSASADWIGATPREIRELHPNRTFWLFERSRLDQLLSQSMAMGRGSFHEQVRALREEAQPLKSPALGKLVSDEVPEPRDHFLLEALESWWTRVLPSNFGLYLRFQGGASASESSERHAFLGLRKGRIEGFFEPDLTNLNPDRKRDVAEVARYLGEAWGVASQGLSVSERDWAEWAESSNPWKGVAQAIRAERAELAPFRWPIAVMIATRGLLGV